MKHKAAVVQMVSGGDVHANLRSAAGLIGQAREQGADLILLPENFAVLDGGPLSQFAERQGDTAALLQGFLQEQARSTGAWLIAGSMPLST